MPRTSLVHNKACGDAQNMHDKGLRRDKHRENRIEARALSADPLLMARESAAETGRGLSTFWRDVKRGVLPAPYYVTPRAPRWRLSELRSVVEAATRAPRAP